MTDDKVKARIERYSHDLFGSDSHPYSGMRENDEGDFVSHEDYLALQSELSQFKAEANRAFELLECVGSDAVFRRIDAEKALIEVTKERDELLASLNAEEMAHNETKKERDGLRAELNQSKQVNMILRSDYFAVREYWLESDKKKWELKAQLAKYEQESTEAIK